MSLGALTTTFSPPASCLSSLTAIAYEDGAYYQGPVLTADCFPEGYEFARSNYYSPGICPSGYYSVGITVNSAADVRETVVTCCPPNMGANTLTDPSWAATMGCSSAFDAITFEDVTMLSNKQSASVKSSTTEEGGALNAFSIQIRFQASDFASTTKSTSTSSTGTSASASSTGDNPDEDNSSGGLSTGAIVGIVIGSVGGVLLLAAACGAAFILGRKRGKEKKAAFDGPGPVSGPSPQMAGMAMGAPTPAPPSQYGSPSAVAAPHQYPYNYSPVSGKPVFPSPNFTPMTHYTGSQSMPGVDTQSNASGMYANTPLQPPVEMPVPDNQTYQSQQQYPPTDHYSQDSQQKQVAQDQPGGTEQSPGWR